MSSSSSGPANFESFTDEAQSKKRARTDDQNSAATPSKKTKCDFPSKKPGRVPKVKMPRPPKVNASTKATLKEKKKEALVTQPKWQTLTATSVPQHRPERTPFTVTALRPRLWTSDREELLAILPEMCGLKSVNGISWLLYPNPMIILDHTTNFFETTKVDDSTIDLITTRFFTCPAASLAESVFDMTALQNSLQDLAMEAIGSTSTINPSFDVKSHHDSTPAIMLHTERRTPSVMMHTPPVGFVAPVAQTLAVKQECNDSNLPIQQVVHSSTYCWDAPCGMTLPEQLADSLRRREDERAKALIDRLGCDESGNCLDSMANGFFFGSSPGLSDHPRGVWNSVSASVQQRLGSKVDPCVEGSFHNSRNDGMSVFVGNSGISDDHCKRCTRCLSDRPIQGCDNKNNSLPRDRDGSLPVPRPIPQEIQALIDAYIFGKPLTVIISNDRLYEHWALDLPREYGYVVMGLYKIIGVEEYRVQYLDPKFISKDFVSGQVRWRFRIQWSAGGEQCIWQNRNDVLKHPWWSPPRESPADGPRRAVGPQPIAEDDFPTTPRYRYFRKRNYEYKWRHHSLQELYHYLFPAHLLVPFTALLPDANFPRGWICRECGRMNFQRSMRRRKCPSLLCKNSEPVSYFLDLFLLRNPHDRLTLPLPYNTYPEDGVKVRHARWDDGIQTFSCLMPDANKPTCHIKHVFTSNLVQLQSYAEEWLKNIQLELDIARKLGDNGPYFRYSATFHQAKPTETTKWSEVPECINNVKDGMINRAKLYAKIEGQDFQFDQLDILAWMTSGSKKNSIPFNATKKSVILLCLGCNVTLNVTPCAKKSFPTLEADEKEENPQAHAGWITKDIGDEPTENLNTSGSPKKQTTTLRHSFVFSLVHGDILVFFGDNFEYSIKRHGTSFLLMGSCSDSEPDNIAVD